MPAFAPSTGKPETRLALVPFHCSRPRSDVMNAVVASENQTAEKFVAAAELTVVQTVPFQYESAPLGPTTTTLAPFDAGA